MKKTPLQQFAILVSSGLLMWGVFFVSSVFAASPYQDQFENYNSEGWTLLPSGATCQNLPDATSTGFVGAGVVMMYHTAGPCAPFAAHISFMHTGTLIGGFGGMQWKIKTTNWTSGRSVVFGFCFVGTPTCQTPSFTYASFSYQPSDENWHTVDMTLQTGTFPTSTVSAYVDGQLVYSTDIASTTNPIFTMYGVYVDAGSTNFGTSDNGTYVYLDSLVNEFSLPSNQSQQDIVNQSYLISTSTTQQLCNGSYATSTGLFGDISNGVSYGLCTVATFLFVPNNTIVNSFTSFNGVLPQKIPFSYYYDFSSVINGQSASSTQNFSPMSVDLASTGVGSTSPWGNILSSLGNFSFLSTTTIMRYISQSTYDLLFLLMRSAIWFAVLFHIYHRIRPKQATAV